jgi:hypothetical protein
MKQPFTIYRLPFTVRSLFPFHGKQKTANAWKTENRKRLIASEGGY